MGNCKPVEITNASFNFCKYSIAATLWFSIIFRSIGLLCFAIVILVFSAILGVNRAPLIVLYRKTIEYFIPSAKIYVNENAVRFAHIIGAIFGVIGVVLILYVDSLIGWIFIGLLAILKTSGAMGFCGAMKLYDCLNNSNGQCCRVGKKIKGSMER